MSTKTCIYRVYQINMEVFHLRSLKYNLGIPRGSLVKIPVLWHLYVIDSVLWFTKKNGVNTKEQKTKEKTLQKSEIT